MNTFDLQYSQNTDPWHIERRWYERRKRALILASLPFETTGVIVEPGCGTGVFTEMLSQRCTKIFACDIAPKAVALAHQRLEKLSNVVLSCQHVPEQWPVPNDLDVDCVVLSEIGYYLNTSQLLHLAKQIDQCLAPSGVIVGCHWRHPFLQRTMPSEEIHETLSHALQLQPLVTHIEQDFLLHVWSRTGLSVAAVEGFA